MKLTKCPYCNARLRFDRLGKHILNVHPTKLKNAKETLEVNGLTVEIFDRALVSQETLHDIKRLILDAVEDMPRIKEKVEKIGLFICGKNRVQQDTQLFRSFVNFQVEVESGPYPIMMTIFFHKKRVAIIIRIEDYDKAPREERERNIRHELAHTLCGHELGRTINSPGHFKAYLPSVTANHVKNTLLAIQEDYEADSLLKEIRPDLLLEYIYIVAKENILVEEKEKLESLDLKAQLLESTLAAIWCKQNLFVLEGLPNNLRSTKKFIETKQLLSERIEFLETYANRSKIKRLPFESLVEDDFKDQYKLKYRYCQIVGFPKALDSLDQ